MLTFSNLIKEIRKSANLNQEEFAKLLGVSKIFIAQLETNKRKPSKNFIKLLAEKLHISTFSLMPFLSDEEVEDFDSLSSLEKAIYKF
jgi:transcriptional regulator with XRE-family HTH domain